MGTPAFKYKYLCLMLVIVFMITPARGQVNKISLEECYSLARDNYPAIKKLDLIAKTSQYNIENAGKNYLPQVSFSGQASYLSTVPQFPTLPGGGSLVPGIGHDLYIFQGNVTENIYDGGVAKLEKEKIRADKELQQQNLEVSLYSIRDRINMLYFSVLLMDAQLSQNEINKSNLDEQAKKTEAALLNGVAFRSNVDELKAEIVNVEMNSTMFRSNRIAYLKMLSLFIGKEIDSSAQLIIPQTAQVQQLNINRPELKEYELQKNVYDIERKQLRTDYTPKLSAFFTGYYSKPSPEILQNKFAWWFLTGLRFSWSLGSLYTLKNHKRLLDINRQSVDVDKETFLFNTNLDLSQEDEEIKKYNQLIEQDKQAIRYRASVKESAQAQLENGVITVHEYIAQSNAENLARQSLILHKIQLLQAQYNYRYKSGND